MIQVPLARLTELKHEKKEILLVYRSVAKNVLQFHWLASSTYFRKSIIVSRMSEKKGQIAPPFKHLIDCFSVKL